MREPIRILIIAEMKEGWSFVACQKALLGMGHRVEVFNVGEVTFPMARSLFWRAAQKLSKAPLVARVNSAFRKFLEDKKSFVPDLILVCKGDYLFPQTLSRAKKATGALLFNWHTDDYFSPTLSSLHAIRSIPLYDAIFVHTKDNLSELLRRGASRVEYLPHGADPSLYHPLDPSSKETYERDVVFLGNWRKERQLFLEQLVSRGIPYRLEIWGYQWEHLPLWSPLRPYVRFAAVAWKEYGSLIRKTKINLVFLTRFDTGSVVVPLRLFEIPAAGGFMLVEKGSGQAREFYQEDREMACFRDVTELHEKIQYFLHRDEDRFRMAQAAQHRAVADGYFYTHKMERLVQVYDELRVSQRTALV